MKDLMTVVLLSVIGLVAFVAYLLYAAKFMFFVAPAELFFVSKMVVGLILLDVL